MYEYQYIVVETGGGFFFDNNSAGHRAVIVGYVPLEFTSHGGIRSMDLIFERKIDQ